MIPDWKSGTTHIKGSVHIVSAYTDPESSGPAENGQEGIKKPGTKSTETGQWGGELPHGTIALFFSFFFIYLFVCLL